VSLTCYLELRCDCSCPDRNTDWSGIKGCLLNASDAGKGRPALIIGAGGACRAAVYALNTELGCKTIYVINRDAEEVASLFKDIQAHATPQSLELVHVISKAQAETLSKVFYIVGTVPDFEPKTESELEVRSILQTFLSKDVEKGVLLDMCYKPRNTRILKLGRSLGWNVVDGTGVIGHQIGEQYRLWAGEEASRNVPLEEAWKILYRAANESKAINF
jgi:quinate dehydrogenase